MTIEATYSQATISDLISRFKEGRINLNPGFQRRSVWSKNDRVLLMKSILANYPIPSIFLYERSHNGRAIFDVIDGKQRMETIFMFTQQGRFKRNRFDVKLELNEHGLQSYDWKSIVKHHHEVSAQLEKYRIQTVEVKGDLTEIIELFVRINSTGKALTPGEKRHAKFINSNTLKEAERLVRKNQKYLTSQRILTSAQIERMKGAELFAELLISIQSQGPINKKRALDRAIANEHVNANTLARVKREFIGTFTLMKKVFPEIKQTRFRNTAEFYSLFLVLWEMRQAGFIFTDKKKNDVALVLLRKFSKGVDELYIQRKSMKSVKAAQQIYINYLQTVQGSTDNISNRESRRTILKSMFWSLFERKDEKRAFTQEQRRIIWGLDENQICPKCKKPLTWNDYTADHILAFAKGGRTSTKNAQPLHKKCNSSKGAR